MTDAVLNNLSLVGNILIFCVGINLVWPRTIKVAKLAAVPSGCSGADGFYESELDEECDCMKKEAICYSCNHLGSCDMCIGVVLWILQSQKQRQSSHWRQSQK